MTKETWIRKNAHHLHTTKTSVYSEILPLVLSPLSCILFSGLCFFLLIHRNILLPYPRDVLLISHQENDIHVPPLLWSWIQNTFFKSIIERHYPFFKRVLISVIWDYTSSLSRVASSTSRRNDRPQTNRQRVGRRMEAPWSRKNF